MDGRTDGRTDKPTELSAISGWMTTSLNLFRGDANLCFKPTVHQKSLISFRDKNHRGKNQAKRDSTRPLSLALSLSHLTANEIRYTFQIFKPFFFPSGFFFSNLFQFDLFLLFFFIFWWMFCYWRELVDLDELLLILRFEVLSAISVNIWFHLSQVFPVCLDFFYLLFIS